MKKVSFNELNNKMYTTYSGDEYDRYPIYSLMYKMHYARNNVNMKNIRDILYMYKNIEMPLHITRILAPNPK